MHFITEFFHVSKENERSESVLVLIFMNLLWVIGIEKGCFKATIVTMRFSL